MRKPLVALLVMAVAGLVSSACGRPAADGGKVEIVAGFYPLQYVAERIGGDQVHVTNLVQPGAEPHDLELSPRQLASIADASLVLYLRGFQPSVDEAVDQNAPAAGFDVAGAVPLLNAPSSDDASSDHGGEDAGGKDPHLWLDPNRLATIATAVGERLATIDPAHADGYRARAAELTSGLDTLDQEFAAGLATCQRREIVTSHAAFGYLADRYRLHQIAITGLSPEAEPTPQHLAAAADAARRSGATTIFFETLVSPKVAQTVADAIGADTAVLDPIEGLEPGSTGDYLSVMRENLATLRPALGCAA